MTRRQKWLVVLFAVMAGSVILAGVLAAPGTRVQVALSQLGLVAALAAGAGILSLVGTLLSRLASIVPKGAGRVLNALLNLVVWLAGLVLVGRGCLILGGQVLEWLKSGIWEGRPALESVGWLAGHEWVRSPDTWIGAWKVLNFVPDWVLNVAVGGTVAFTVWLDMEGPFKPLPTDENQQE
jgi:hypothetical protein